MLTNINITKCYVDGIYASTILSVCECPSDDLCFCSKNICDFGRLIYQNESEIKFENKIKTINRAQFRTIIFLINEHTFDNEILWSKLKDNNFLYRYNRLMRSMVQLQLCNIQMILCWLGSPLKKIYLSLLCET